MVEQTQEPTFHKMLVQQAKINNELIEKEQENFRNKEKTIVIDESLWESIDIEK